MTEQLHLKIPASTANLGVGFDSIGMAIDKYLHLYVKRIEEEEWEFTYLNSELDSLPKNKTIMFLKWLSKSHLNIM